MPQVAGATSEQLGGAETSLECPCRGAGQRSLSVVTPWGSSEPADFLLVLEAREHDGGHLDWYSFVRRVRGTPPPTLGAPAPERTPVPLDCTAIPTPVSYPGMPVLRWWQLEDQRVDFGAVAAGPNELLKLVLLELATVYGNDWFTIPVDKLPVGALCELDSVTVTDAFGFSRGLAPFGNDAGSDWRMFELTRDDGVTNAGNVLLLLDALPATLESSPVEEVLLLRDELANMAWAVEKVIESCTGRPFDRHEDEVTRRARPAPPTAGAPRRYLLQTTTTAGASWTRAGGSPPSATQIAIAPRPPRPSVRSLRWRPPG